MSNKETGTKKRSSIPMRSSSAIPRVSVVKQSTEIVDSKSIRRCRDDENTGQVDSGLSSSECTTPTNNSPSPCKQQSTINVVAGHIPIRRKMIDIIAASKARLQLAEKRLVFFL